MIDLKKYLFENALHCTGIIHVGGHKAQEHQEYKDAGILNQVWIEANPHFYYEILNVVGSDKNCTVLNYAVYDEEKMINFGLANNGASSSILPLKEHKKYYPNITYDGYISLETKRLDNILNLHNINLKEYNGLVLDVQGVELNVLKSLGELLHNFKFVQSEVNIEELYEGCCLIDELDSYLNKYGFDRVETKLWEDGAVGWGDALYVKNG